MSGKYALVIDKGSTNVKAVLFDLDGNEQLCVSKPCKQPSSPHPGWCEQDMNDIWRAVTLAIQEVTAQIENPENIAGIGVTGQGSGLFTVDRSGDPVRAGILSLDPRASGLVDVWQEDGRAHWFFDYMNAEILPCYPVPLLAWLKKYEPESYRRIDKILFSKDWVKYKLTGEISTDITDVGPSCLLDLKTMEYFHQSFDKFEVPEMLQALPEIIPSYKVAGYVTKEAAALTGLSEKTPVFSGAHDMMACPFGVGTLEEDQVICVAGTWGMNFKSAKIRQGTFSFPHVIPDHYIVGRCDGNSGSVQDRMLEMLCPDELSAKYQQTPYQYSQTLAREAPNSNLLFHPYLFGALYDPNACGGFYGLRDWHSRGDMIKSVFEGIVFGHYANIKTITGYEKFTTIWLVGGGAKNEYLAQLFADITGLQVKTAASSEVTARGVVLAMRIGLGICDDYEAACIPVEVKKQYVPNPDNTAFYREKFALYEHLYKVMTPMWNDMKKLI